MLPSRRELSVQMVSLRGMTEGEFEVFLAESIPEYATEKVKAGNWDAKEALRRSREEHTKLLPEGLTSPNQNLYVVELDGNPVGRLWLSLDADVAGGAGFVYDLFVEEPFRRRGIAAQAMVLLEKEAVRLGLRSLALHVFGYNLPARALYQKLGYEITNINMSKDLTSVLDR
jgi:ribosomal protein S18 acetylase RimI-like enzyme